MEDFFSVQDLKKTFGALKIDVSFSCKKNTMTALVGMSGSGKSTVLRLICGLEKCNANEKYKITLDGEDLTNVPVSKRKIGMVFQNGALFNHLKVIDNVAYGLISQGIPKSKARKIAQNMLERFGLSGFDQRFPDTLSGGEAQRVSLARTLVLEPKLVLFDEPLSALDAPLRKKLAEEIANLQRQIGFTGILVTHDIDEAKFLCQKINLMKNGQIVWSGSPANFSIDKYF